jgi:quercetin dioxygenase-like cupin family protein
VPADLRWTPNPSVQGSEIAVLAGDPKKPGPDAMRIKFPPDINNNPHTHPDKRVVTIISGTWNFGHSDTFDASKEKSLPQGTFFTEPANAVHYNFTKTEPVVIQIHGMGPTGTTPVKK